MITTWHLHSHRTRDRLCHSCVGSSFLPRGAFLGGGAYAVYCGLHAGSLESLRFTRPRAVDLECIRPRPTPGVPWVASNDDRSSIPRSSPMSEIQTRTNEG